LHNRGLWIASLLRVCREMSREQLDAAMVQDALEVARGHILYRAAQRKAIVESAIAEWLAQAPPAASASSSPAPSTSSATLAVPGLPHQPPSASPQPPIASPSPPPGAIHRRDIDAIRLEHAALEAQEAALSQQLSQLTRQLATARTERQGPGPRYEVLLAVTLLEQQTRQIDVQPLKEALSAVSVTLAATSALKTAHKSWEGVVPEALRLLQEAAVPRPIDMAARDALLAAAHTQ